jgi:hypothetical protein
MFASFIFPLVFGSRKKIQAHKKQLFMISEAKITILFYCILFFLKYSYSCFAIDKLIFINKFFIKNNTMYVARKHNENSNVNKYFKN